MARNIEDHIRIVRGLLRNAEDPRLTEDARASYNAKAQTLITKFAIDSANLGTDTPADPIITESLGVHLKKGTPMIKARRALWSKLAAINSCRIVWYGANGRDGGVLMGHTSDIAAVVMLHESIMTQLVMDVAVIGQATGIRSTSFQVSFAHGYVQRVGERLDAARASTVAGSGAPGTALVLVDRGNAVERARDDRFKKLTTVRSTHSINSAGGFYAGRDAANRADLGGTRMGGADRPAIG
jgi:hypothetical protein